MKYLILIWNKLVENFTCEILVHETYISHGSWFHVWNFHFTYWIETIHIWNIILICEIACEIFVKEFFGICFMKALSILWMTHMSQTSGSVEDAVHNIGFEPTKFLLVIFSHLSTSKTGGHRKINGCFLNVCGYLRVGAWRYQGWPINVRQTLTSEKPWHYIKNIISNISSLPRRQQQCNTKGGGGQLGLLPCVENFVGRQFQKQKFNFWVILSRFKDILLCSTKC